MDGEVYEVDGKLYLKSDLVDAYPAAVKSIIYCEASAIAVGKGIWWGSMVRAIRNKGLDYLIDILSTTAVQNGDSLAAAQFSTDDFRRYIIGRLGMM